MGRGRFQPAILLTLLVAAACGSPTTPTASVPLSTVTLPTASATPATTISPRPATVPPPTLGPSLPTTPSATQAVVDTPSSLSCTSEDPSLAITKQLTIGFSEPAVPPWFGGEAAVAYPGEPQGTAWEVSDPYSAEGFEGALAYAIAARLGFDREAVQWLVVDRAAAVAVGPKPFDLYISQAVPTITTLGTVGYSRAYYEPNDAVLGLFENPIADVATVEGLRAHRLGAVTATSGEVLIRQLILPNFAPSTYPDLEAAGSALEFDEIDGLVVDLPTAFRLRDEEIPGAVVVGQFETTARDLGLVIGLPTGYSAILQKDSLLTGCVDGILDALDGTGAIDGLRLTWLVDRANAPMLE